MAVRVAITDFLVQMDNPDALGEDDHGRSMTKAYRDRIEEVLTIICR